MTINQVIAELKKYKKKLGGEAKVVTRQSDLEYCYEIAILNKDDKHDDDGVIICSIYK